MNIQEAHIFHPIIEYQALQDYRLEGCFRNPYNRHSDEWRAYHAVESKQLLKEISGEE